MNLRSEMLNEQQHLLDNFRQRVSELISACSSLRRRNMLLEEQLLKEKTDGEHLKLRLEQLQKQYENLRMAKQMSGESGASEATKLRLNKLVREIDKCIEMLKD